MLMVNLHDCIQSLHSVVAEKGKRDSKLIKACPSQIHSLLNNTVHESEVKANVLSINARQAILKSVNEDIYMTSSIQVVLLMAVFLAGASADISSHHRHPCDRECTAAAKECIYTFEVELYQTLSRACRDCPRNITDCDRKHCISGDGVERGLIVVNRRMPGEPVIVCQGDTVVVQGTPHI